MLDNQIKSTVFGAGRETKMLVSGKRIENQQKIQGAPITLERLGGVLQLRDVLSGAVVPDGWITLYRVFHPDMSISISAE
jgi:hypothetical protein